LSDFGGSQRMKRAVAGVMHSNTSPASAILNGLNCNLADRIKTCIMLALPDIPSLRSQAMRQQNTDSLQHRDPSTCKTCVPGNFTKSA